VPEVTEDWDGKCILCFWGNDFESVGDIGRCMFNPPTLLSNSTHSQSSGFPKILANDYCRKYQRDEKRQIFGEKVYISESGSKITEVKSSMPDITQKRQGERKEYRY
jgi:hypothetical protein